MTYLKIPQVAQRLNVSTVTIRRLIDRGELEAVKIGRVLRVADEAVDAYLEHHLVGGGR